MLSSTGLEALKALSSNLFGSIDEEALTLPEGETFSEEQLRALKASVDTLRSAASAGFKESESRLKEAVRLLEEDGERRTKAFASILFDLFGVRDRAAFLAEFQSFAQGIVAADALVNTAFIDAERALDKVTRLQARVQEVETSVAGLFNHVTNGAQKTANIIKALSTRFNGELTALDARISTLDLASPGSSDPLDSLMSSSGLPPPQGQVFLAGYHH
jgi:hypothetical protein